jgi:acyl-CoA thioesterase FadM
VHTIEGESHEGWPRIEVSCKYHKPARFEQTLEVCLRIEELRTSSLRYGFWIFIADDPSRALVATGSFSTIHVEIDHAPHGIRKAPIPAALRAKLESAMKSN